MLFTLSSTRLNLHRNVLMMGLVAQCFGVGTAFAQHLNEPSADTTQHAADSIVRSKSDSTSKATTERLEFLRDKFVLGATLGSPGFLNLVAGRYFGRFGFRVAAGLPFFVLGWIPNLWWEGDVSYIIARSSGALAEVFLFETRFDDPIDGRKFWGAGIGVAVNLEGLFAAGGFSLWNHPGYYDSYPFQIGYVH